jgi:hypothetical protein
MDDDPRFFVRSLFLVRHPTRLPRISSAAILAPLPGAFVSISAMAKLTQYRMTVRTI